MNELTQQVEAAIQVRQLFPDNQPILVAVSGGVDSMVLLHLLHSIAARHAWRLHAVHFNHQLRGIESDADEALVVATCAKLGIPCACGTRNVSAMAREQKLSLEMAARHARHEFLAETAKNIKIPRIALAHHADDQVELFFLRLLRGAGFDGLAGMKWINPSPVDNQVHLCRPLLDASKQALMEHARLLSIPFREDATNASNEIRRNHLRNAVIPLLKSGHQSALETVILRQMSVMGETAEYLAQQVSRWMTATNKEPFETLHPCLQRAILYSQLRPVHPETDFELVEQLRTLVDTPVTATHGLHFSRNREGTIATHTPEKPSFNQDEQILNISMETGEINFHSTTLNWLLIHDSKRPPSARGREYFDADQVGKRIRLRFWREGDRFRPIGSASSVKLQDWFVNNKIPADKRRSLIVAENASGEIFWIENQRIAESCKVTPATTLILEWRWQRPS